MDSKGWSVKDDRNISDDSSSSDDPPYLIEVPQENIGEIIKIIMYLVL
jgi:hypothetical protein